MDRRKFITQTSLLSAAALLPISCGEKPSSAVSTAATHSPKYKMGYQLYSIRDEMAKDPIATLKALKAMGYEDFEAYGFDEENEKFYGYKAAEFKKIVDDLGLSITSGHYGFSPYLNESDDKMKRYVDQCISGAKALNNKYITWPWISPEQRTMENFRKMPAKLNRIGAQITAAGLGFAYHNHGFEFEDHDGENGFDLIINETNPDTVKLEMDMYWVMHSSKYTPKELISKQPGRYVMWHLKDIDKVTRDYTELGNGSIDYVKHLPDPKESGLEFLYIEQGGNFATNSTKSAADSAAYYKEYLKSMV